jgi:IS605 OrfB family transposase
MLSCPVQVVRPAYQKDTDIDRVCSVDVGFNTAATAAVVDSTGTVIARKFDTCGRHNDQRDKLAAQVADKQGKSHGGGDHRPGKGFCAKLYRRIAGLNLDAARRMASELAAFARELGAKVLVIEGLKGWRPKGPSKALRKKFHRFQHRMLVKYLSGKAEEYGIRLMEVYPRGTSRWAFDGSGKVIRDKKNAQLATFPSKKKYNADLNAAYNIAARGLAKLLKVAVPRLVGNDKSVETGKSSGSASRMPIVLADIWAFHAQNLAVAR